jgi:hypothetical protein
LRRLPRRLRRRKRASGVRAVSPSSQFTLAHGSADGQRRLPAGLSCISFARLSPPGSGRTLRVVHLCALPRECGRSSRISRLTADLPFRDST